jgi:hypothetical protein
MKLFKVIFRSKNSFDHFQDAANINCQITTSGTYVGLFRIESDDQMYIEECLEEDGNILIYDIWEVVE